MGAFRLSFHVRSGARFTALGDARGVPVQCALFGCSEFERTAMAGAGRGSCTAGDLDFGPGRDSGPAVGPGGRGSRTRGGAVVGTGTRCAGRLRQVGSGLGPGGCGRFRASACAPRGIRAGGWWRPGLRLSLSRLVSLRHCVGSRNRPLAALARAGQRSFPAAGLALGPASPALFLSPCPLGNILPRPGRPA